MNIEGSYNLYIVALSVVIAVLASYSALNIVTKISLAKGKTRFFWLLAGSLVMGNGIWSMHFVGMLAYHTHMTVHYDIWFTLGSLLASVIASFIAFYITMPRNTNWYKIAGGGFIIGSGIVTMHYMGMEAMIIPNAIYYDPVLLVLSIIIALVASYLALLLFLHFQSESKTSWVKWLSAALMGIAICGMHYTAMEAVKLQHPAAAKAMAPTPAGQELFLLLCVMIVIFIILLVSWGALIFERHVLEKLAYLDSVTGLPNRNEMNRFFDSHVGTEKIGVLFLDLDQFKAINDTLGHNIGDLLIQEVGIRLRQFIREDQQAFRIGGDEFLFIIKQCNTARAEQLAHKILYSIKQVYYIEGNELYVTGSIGISIGSIQDSNRSVLLKTADTAMYRAKGLGKNQICFYSEEMGLQLVRKMELEKDLQLALENNQFFIMYQPKWNVKTNSLVGFEALIRWQHPRLGLVAPGEFIQIAEGTGLIVPMTKWALEQACRQCKEWQSQGLQQPVSVNLSVRLFQNDSLQELVQNVLDKFELAPHLLELEITESMVLYDINDIIRQLQGLRELGVRVSMDDFGTGYSSIGLLDRLPIDALKLDRLFTNDLENPSKRAVINAIIMMANNLQLDIIAEGVENQEHIDLLARLGCYVMQGYYYGEPMREAEIHEWVRTNEHNMSVV
ncbi:bifunctional diguanylate cyclase/phosphodiesterase [Paenibacillus lentus]|uniref:Bifunctional diguanylate cyclase/phosphodiesterase n=1 Tax=Paenibacillus lentus TaxID=1338368 RepID=A0A3Q8SBH3_9BACL|nr:bifunctional diguanylate cyclase/phosphodiesterase [Paenibacillus lentus]AZK46940.1 bifunctional diguanylate cyclase/phosphodiesterase [Paenibacillus lentus]